MKSSNTMAWRACVVAAIVASVSTMEYRALTLFYDTILQNTGCTSGEYGLVFSTIAVGLVIGGLVTGKLLEWNLKVSTALCSLAPLVLFLAIGLAKNIVVLYAAGFLFGFLYNPVGMTMYSVVIARWFNRGRGKVLSIGVISMFGSQAILVPLFANWVITFGGTVTALGVGIVATAIMIPLMVFVMPWFPDHYGIEPADVGKEKTVAEQTDATGAFANHANIGLNLPASRAWRTGPFILLFVAFFFCCGGYSNFTANSITIFQSFGVSYIDASIGVSVSSVAAMVLALVEGAAIDKLGPKKTIVFFIAVAAATCFTTAFMHGMTGVWIFGILINFAGIYELIGGAVVPGLFGQKNSAQLIAWLMMAGNTAIIFFPALGATIYGSTGSYVITYAIAGVILIISAVLMLVALSSRSYKAIRELDARQEAPAEEEGESVESSVIAG